MKKYRQPLSGFSLIELMVVIAIVALLTAVAVPSYKNYTTKARIAEIIKVLEFNKNVIDEYISKKGTVPGAANYTPVGTSPYGTYKWEGQFGLSFWFNTVLHTPVGGNLDIIYLRPHPSNNGAITRWSCSVWGGLSNPFYDYLPAACAADDTWDYPEG